MLLLMVKEDFESLMKNQKNIRNIAVAAHIDHGKTTFSDNLLSGAGMLSEKTAGRQRVLDFHEDEAERGITIDSASVSMVHRINDENYLVNLIDTPGHVDFGGDVTRAMRAVDGAIVLTCAVEGVMPQTETVLRQALKELVKPVLFINKVDRLIREVKLTPQAMQEKFISIINEVNQLIENIAPEAYKEKWKVSVSDGSVTFGSAFHNWALSFPYMKEHNLSFKDVIEAYETDNYDSLAKKAPLHKVILEMVIKHLPDPVNAQSYRIPKIWKGELDSPVGKALLSSDMKGPAIFVPIKIVLDKNAGEVAEGRLFSGNLKQGDELYLNLAKKRTKVQQVSIYKGQQRIIMKEVVSGNIIGIVGLKGVIVGDTASKEEMEPFESIKHLFEPVVTKSIEPKRAIDLPKLVNILNQMSKEDPSIKIDINEQTGESLLSGMGELHLEIIENRIRTEKGLDIKTSNPIVVYHETVTKESPAIEGRSPNKHNSFYMKVEPLDGKTYEAIRKGDVPERRIKKKNLEIAKIFSEIGWIGEDIRNIRDVYKGNIFLDETRGEVLINEVIGMVIEAFEMVMDCGPIAREPCMKLKVSLVDTRIHEDPVHRGPGQVYPAVSKGIKEAMKKADPTLLEPLQTQIIEGPEKFLGAITKLISGKRGQIINVDQEGTNIEVKAKLPVADMMGWSNDLRSATEGRGNSSLLAQSFEVVPRNLKDEIIRKIRQRKGLSENQ